MRAMLCFLLVFPGVSWAEPNCEQVYWGEVVDGALGTDFGLLPLDKAPKDARFTAARGADQEDPEAVDYCPTVYRALELPKLMMKSGETLSDIPDDWGKNADHYEALVVADPDGAGTSSVTVFWDAGDTLVPMRTVFLAEQADSGGSQTILNFSEIAGLFPNGDGLLFIHDLYGPVIKTHYMRWSVH